RSASGPRSRRRRRGPCSYVEADVQDVAVLDDVRLAFEPLLAGPRDLGVRSCGDEVVPAHDLAADEAARDVGVDRRGRVERRLPATERPRAGLLLARGEEGDQVERLRELPDDRAERRLAAAAELRRLVVGELGELGLELEVDALASVHDRDQRLRRERVELGRQLAGIAGEPVAGVEVAEQLLELLDLLAELR